MLTTPHKPHHPHPARRQLRRRRPPVGLAPRVLPVATVAVRLAWEQDAEHHGLRRTAAWWRWRAADRGEVAVRGAPGRGGA